jgi:hypothetical protein
VFLLPSLLLSLQVVGAADHGGLLPGLHYLGCGLHAQELPAAMISTNWLARSIPTCAQRGLNMTVQSDGSSSNASNKSVQVDMWFAMERLSLMFGWREQLQEQQGTASAVSCI